MNNFNPKLPERLISIDALRGLAVLLMIEQHLGMWLWSKHAQLFKHPFMLCFNGLGGFAAPAFITLAGLGCSLAGYRHTKTDQRLIVRGLVLVFFGYLLNIMTPSWFSPGSWYVLHMIGFALMLSPFLKRLPSSVLILIFIIILITTVSIQDFLATPLKISNFRMSNVNLPGGVFRLALVEGHFPVFPWLAFFITGILTGRWLIHKNMRNIFYMAMMVLSIGLSLTACNAFGFKFAVQGPLLRACKILPRIYPALLPISLLLIALVLLSIIMFTMIESKGKISSINPLVCLGRTSLSLLIIHVLLFREISRYMHFWRIFSQTQTLAIICAILVLSAFAAVRWRRHNYRFGAEWLLRKIAG